MRLDMDESRSKHFSNLSSGKIGIVCSCPLQRIGNDSILKGDTIFLNNRIQRKIRICPSIIYGKDNKMSVGKTSAILIILQFSKGTYMDFFMRSQVGNIMHLTIYFSRTNIISIGSKSCSMHHTRTYMMIHIHGNLWRLDTRDPFGSGSSQKDENT